MNPQLIENLGLKLGANGLPYLFPLHPVLVHFTLGLFIIAILFDIAGTLFSIDRPIFNLFSIPVMRSGLYDIGWYNLVGAVSITFFTVAIGFFEMLLATPAAEMKSSWGLTVGATMLLHGVGGVLLLAVMAGMLLWRGLQRYRWRLKKVRQVQWSYLLVGVLMMGALYVHGTLGGQMGDEFGFHNTAGNLIQAGKDPNQLLRP